MKKLLILFAFIISSCVSNTYYARPHTEDGFSAYRSVALLYIKHPDGGGVVATGFAYDGGNIITAGHFCDEVLKIQDLEPYEQSISMKYYDHYMEIKTKKNIEIREISGTQDLCMLEKKNHGLIPLRVIKDYSTVVIRDKVTIIGVPNGTVVGEFPGRVMSVSYNGFGRKSIKGNITVSAASTGGVSGSPIILDRTGEVIGVLVRGHSHFDHLSFGVNGEKINEFIDELE